MSPALPPSLPCSLFLSLFWFLGQNCTAHLESSCPSKSCSLLSPVAKKRALNLIFKYQGPLNQSSAFQILWLSLAQPHPSLPPLVPGLQLSWTSPTLFCWQDFGAMFYGIIRGFPFLVCAMGAWRESISSSVSPESCGRELPSLPVPWEPRRAGCSWGWGCPCHPPAVLGVSLTSLGSSCPLLNCSPSFGSSSSLSSSPCVMGGGFRGVWCARPGQIFPIHSKFSKTCGH